MKAICVILCAILAAVAAASRASAQMAEIHPVRGEILVNVGEGYRPIAGVVELKPGDAAMVGSRGLGQLIYADGCRVDVVPGSVVWIRARSPCTANASPAPSRDPEPALEPRMAFDPSWLTEGAALIDSRKPPAGP